MSMAYIVGLNPNSPLNPHSAMASGGSDIGDIDDSPPNEAYILYGAVVGGRDKKDRFWDIRLVCYLSPFPSLSLSQVERRITKSCVRFFFPFCADPIIYKRRSLSTTTLLC